MLQKHQGVLWICPNSVILFVNFKSCVFYPSKTFQSLFSQQTNMFLIKIISIMQTLKANTKIQIFSPVKCQLLWVATLARRVSDLYGSKWKIITVVWNTKPMEPIVALNTVMPLKSARQKPQKKIRWIEFQPRKIVFYWHRPQLLIKSTLPLCRCRSHSYKMSPLLWIKISSTHGDMKYSE